ncbi:hypothetical protein [Haladaptatus caseinilyticus]|uniref:hypothetical protein n=1 Tax=Haladaptatus caseinilyticus TaxID=2993314 RepID=UPI00224A7B51|nr:hypothetical protein [Haladaptatus caseinilyticus]
MPTQRRRRFVYGQTVWMLLCLFVLNVLQTYSGDLFFAMSFLGFLVLTELTAPVSLTPLWRRRLRWFIVFGFAVFGLIVIRRILAILPPGVL